jgi:hypothetical protein
VPDFATIPTRPGMKQGSGWNPILHLPIAEMIPGQLAPTILDFD